jgi:hypothetical protein
MNTCRYNVAISGLNPIIVDLYDRFNMLIEFDRHQDILGNAETAFSSNITAASIAEFEKTICECEARDQAAADIEAERSIVPNPFYVDDTEFNESYEEDYYGDDEDPELDTTDDESDPGDALAIFLRS